MYAHAFHFDEKSEEDGKSSLFAFHFEAGGWVENQDVVLRNQAHREATSEEDGHHPGSEDGGGMLGGSSSQQHPVVAQGGEFDFFFGQGGKLPEEAAIAAFLRTRRLKSLPKTLKVCNQSGRFGYRTAEFNEEEE